MGKKKPNVALGKSLIKDRFCSHAHKQPDTYLHSSELGDGMDWNKINLKSVTEENTLDEFLATAELAGTEFTAERLNVTIVESASHSGLLTKEEELTIKEAQEKHKEFLKIPRRPEWDEHTTADELDVQEKNSFLEWRRELAKLQDVEGIILTPFERNLDFWRQLWRVIERSDVVVQIVDARNPLLYRCEDLEVYVKEVSEAKLNVILINKADFLTDEQRKHWASYFDRVGMKVVFWSAMLETERLKEMEKLDQSHDSDNEMEEDISSDEFEDSGMEDSTEEQEADEIDANKETVEQKSISENENHISGHTDASVVSDTNHLDTSKSDPQELSSTSSPVTEEAGPPLDSKVNDSRILNGDELVDFFKSFHTGHTYTEGVTTIGLVGYPNVGKSSTINAILQTKKVPVSATPGRTKHFQTLFLDKTLMLCDCPGLVMPTFVSTKAEMINSGILPIDQMRDYVPPVSLICQLIPRKLLEGTYGIFLPPPGEGESPDKPPTSHQFLGSHAFMRGFMTHKGVPDYQKSARLVLKDFVKGKLLHSNPPPGVPCEDFRPTEKLSTYVAQRTLTGVHSKGSAAQSSTQGEQATAKVQKVTYKNEVDKDFFSKREVKAGSKGVKGVVGYTRSEGLGSHHSSGSTTSSQAGDGKSWKKHNNFRKKEKLRRLNQKYDA